MKRSITALILVLATFSFQASAKPSAGVVDACLRTESAAQHVHYTRIATEAFHVTEDEAAGKTDITLRHGKDTIGTWEVQKPPTFGLVFNKKQTSLAHVTRLDKNQAPAPFSPYEAMWGIVREGRASYVCATFNFDGLGKSGSFQNVRGLYLIERGMTSSKIFYTVGNVAGSAEEGSKTEGAGASENP